jgi:outer membrane receptor protein involved in Fe transport
LSPGLWSEARWKPIPALTLTTGLRADLYKYSTYQDPHFTLSPRLAARLEVRDDLAFKGGAGLYTEGARNGDAARPFGNPALLPERAWQTTVGLESKPVPGIFISAELYYKWLDQVISTTDATTLQGSDLVPLVLANTGIGHVYGAELLIRKELSDRFFGWLAYSLSRSVRLDRPGAAWRLFDFDQTQALTLIVSRKFPGGWQAGGRFRIITGNPETPVIGARYLASDDVYLPIYGPTNSARLPIFHQLDVRLDKVWTFDNWMLDLYLDVVNAYNHRATEATTYGYDYSQQQAFLGLPILPSIGAKGSF